MIITTGITIAVTFVIGARVPRRCFRSDPVHSGANTENGDDNNTKKKKKHSSNNYDSGADNSDNPSRKQ